MATAAPMVAVGAGGLRWGEARGRGLILLAASCLNVLALPSARAASGAPQDSAFQIGLIGDTGYSPEQDDQLLAARSDMGRFPLAFVVHDGDTQYGTSPCTDARLEYVRGVFDGFAAPFVYTPGDNEWSECPNDDPQARLAAIRRIYFPSDETLGGTRFTVERQRPTFVENARWHRNGVWFATLNVPGPEGSGYCVPADLAWLNGTFDEAEAAGAAAVMLIWQDDPFSDGSSRQLTSALKERALDFHRPVVLVHGDTHVHRVDHPWKDVPNFTRVETFALRDGEHWVRAVVDPTSPQVFTFTSARAR